MSKKELKKYQLINGDCVKEMAKLPENSIDSIVCDPPYGLKFMNKEFDDLGEGAQQREWHRLWAVEALRVLKPGGHLLAFGGTRTYHHLATGLEEAGFEIRDQIQWLYGSGFPKSYNVGKAIDKRGGEQILWFGKWLKEWRTKQGITQKEIAALFPSKTNGLTGCVANWELGHNLPTPDQFNLICETFNLPFKNIKEAERQVVGKGKSAIANKEEGQRYTVGASKAVEFNLTAPATSEAAKWEGWGTALKPANEPVVLARKPFKGTIAENVQEWGTGAVNVDGCRVGSGGHLKWSEPRGMGFSGGNGKSEGEATSSKEGRWPANVILDEEAGELLDQEANQKEGPSRFFYCPKAAKKERNAGLDGFEEKDRGVGALKDGGRKNTSPAANNHPTVKPISLMSYLIRLITPPGGTVLDPFLGSGSTGCAAMVEDSVDNFIGIEQDPEYMKIAEARIKHWQSQQQEQEENEE